MLLHASICLSFKLLVNYSLYRFVMYLFIPFFPQFWAIINKASVNIPIEVLLDKYVGV